MPHPSKIMEYEKILRDFLWQIRDNDAALQTV